MSFVFVFHQQNFYENPKVDTSMKRNRDLHQISRATFKQYFLRDDYMQKTANGLPGGPSSPACRELLLSRSRASGLNFRPTVLEYWHDVSVCTLACKLGSRIRGWMPWSRSFIRAVCCLSKRLGEKNRKAYLLKTVLYR